MSEPCKNCPETTPETVAHTEMVAPIKGPKSGWVIYTGGPLELHLSMMQHILPEGYSRARFLPDGSIQYEKGPDDWEPPSPIQGYAHDPEDYWLFRPLWKSCQLRAFGAEVKEGCECIQVVALCYHPEVAFNANGEVTFDMCESCPHREPIQVVPKIERTPPPKPFRGQATTRNQ